MLKKIGMSMAFICVLTISVGFTNVFAAACGCPKEVKCKEHCEKGKTDPCPCHK